VPSAPIAHFDYGPWGVAPQARKGLDTACIAKVQRPPFKLPAQ